MIKQDLKEDEVVHLKFHYHLIINPASGGGKGKTHSDTIIELLKKHKYDYTTYYTQYPDHELTYVDELNESVLRPWEIPSAETFPLLMVIGGDGTLHQVIERLDYLQNKAPVSYIPAGSGNDFARGFGVPLEPVQAFWQIVKAQEPQKINILSYDEKISEKKGIIMNSLGIGIDGAIIYQTVQADKKALFNSFLAAKLVYIVPLFKALFTQRGFPVLIEANGQEFNFKKAFLCTMTNHPYFGGGIAIAPMADSQSSELECLVVEKHGPLKILFLILLLIFKKQEKSKAFVHFPTTKLRIVSITQQYCQIDGEVIPHNAFDFTLQPKKQMMWF